MGLVEIVSLVALRNVATAIQNVAYAGATAATSVTGKAAWRQAGQIAGQVASAAAKGLTAASNEFAALQTLQETVATDEKAFAAWVQTLQPPTP